MKHRRGFTLIEILLATGLAAVISAAVLVPIIYTVNSLEKAQEEFGKFMDVDSAVSAIFCDIRNSSNELPQPVIKTENKNSLSVNEDGRLIVWTSSPSNEGKAAGAVVYRIMRESDGESYGLYRWILNPETTENGDTDIISRDKREITGPAERDTEVLKREDGRLILKEAKGITFEVNNGNGWEREYSGNLPKAFRIKVRVKEKERIYEEALPFAR